MDGRSCVVCRKPVTLGDSFQHVECKHRTHTKCIDMSKVNVATCDHCLGFVDLNAPLVPELEPGSLSGVDYIDNPLQDPSAARRLLSTAVGAVVPRRAQNKETAQDPHTLLAFGPAQCPIDWLIREKNLGLQRFLESGVTLDTFLQHGYKWPDLLLFQDLSKRGPERAQRALLALRINAGHIRGPLREHVKELPFSPKDMVELLGVYFAPNSVRLECPGDSKPWTARELAALGWRAKDLYGAGLEYVEQYQSLDPDDDDDAALGIGPHDIEQLKSMETLALPVQVEVSQVVQQLEQPTETVIRIVQPAPRVIYREPNTKKPLHGLKTKKR